MFNFKKIDAWQKAVVFADCAYSHVKSFPEPERFGPTSQLRRAAVSVPSNIAEGSSRPSRSDFARFVEIATGSLFEVVSQATIAQRQGFMEQTAYLRFRDSAEELARILSGLRKSLLESPA